MSDSRQDVHPTPCPSCGYKLDAATSVATIDAREMKRLDDARPKPNDLTVCIGCGGILVFVDAGAGKVSVREFTEQDKIYSDPEGFALLQGLRAKIVAKLRERSESN